MKMRRCRRTVSVWMRRWWKRRRKRWRIRWRWGRRRRRRMWWRYRKWCWKRLRRNGGGQGKRKSTEGRAGG